MAFTVVYDANVLYPAPLRDMLVRIGMTGVVRVKWTDEILDEEVESQETSNVTAQSNGLGDLCMLQHLLLRVMAIDVPGSA